VNGDDSKFTAFFKATLSKCEMRPFSIRKNDFGKLNSEWYKNIHDDGRDYREPTRKDLGEMLQFLNEVAESRSGQPYKIEKTRGISINHLHGVTDLLKGSRTGEKLTEPSANAGKMVENYIAKNKQAAKADQMAALKDLGDAPDPQVLEKSLGFLILNDDATHCGFYL
jgi:hypothetical protein